MRSSLIQTPDIFLDDLIATIKKAKQRIYIQSMLFESGVLIDRLTGALADASLRGVEVKLIYDWVSNRYVHNTLRFFPKFDPATLQYNRTVHRRTYESVRYLQSCGVDVTIINHPVLFEYLFPVMNRNHSKLYIIDDFCGWVGGVNLSDVSFRNTDCMVKVFSDCLISALSEYFLKVWNRSLEKDYSVTCSDDYTLSFDSGKHGRSLIYETGISLVKTAEKNITFLSQFVPNGPLLEQLIGKAKQHIPITIITSHRNNVMFTVFPYVLFYKYFLARIAAFPSIRFLHHREKIHAKLLIIDEKEILIGSHNMAFSGVLFGTQEISLWSKDPALVHQLHIFAKEVALKSLVDTH
jgi:phosphatidylserine/phosphatidylglycerophosphate/cardiolipin synthase-like enzyme